MTNEIARLIRHIITPLVLLLVQAGWLPEAMQGDVTEAVIIILTLVLTFLWSWYNEQKALKKDPPK